MTINGCQLESTQTFVTVDDLLTFLLNLGDHDRVANDLHTQCWLLHEIVKRHKF